MTAAAEPRIPADRPVANGGVTWLLVAGIVLAVGLALATYGYWHGSRWQAYQDSDRARVSVDFSQAATYRTPLRRTDRPAAATLVAVDGLHRGPFASWEERYAEAPRTTAALSGVRGRVTVQDENGDEVWSMTLRPNASGFLSRGAPFALVSDQVPPGDYMLMIEIARPVPEAGVYDVFVYDRLYEMPVLVAIWQMIFGVAIAGLGGLMFLTAAAYVWRCRLRADSTTGSPGNAPVPEERGAG